MALRKRPVAGGISRPRTVRDPSSPYWIFGRHAVRAALANPRREIRKVIAADADAAAALPKRAGRPTPPAPEIVARSRFADYLPGDVVHQGVAALVAPLPQPALEHGCAAASAVIALDQVTDPRNVGAVLRSAAAFGAGAVIVAARRAPPESGALAKAASGALDLVPLIRTANLARALDRLKGLGFWILGLDDRSPTELRDALGDRSRARRCLVLGSEGGGLRRLTAERCDLLARLPTEDRLASLNVSAAAAVALYELVRSR